MAAADRRRDHHAREKAAYLYSALEVVETALADLYGWLSTALADDAEVAHLFTKMRAEELRHVEWVKRQQWGATLGNLDVPDFRETHTATVTQAIDRFRAKHPTPDAETALRFALELESSTAEAHRRIGQHGDEPSVATLLEKLGEADDRHVAELEELARRRGI